MNTSVVEANGQRLSRQMNVPVHLALRERQGQAAGEMNLSECWNSRAQDAVFNGTPVRIERTCRR